MLKPGVTAGELDQFARKFISNHDARPSFLGYEGFKYAICVSIDDEVVHGIASEDKIIPNNCLISLDLGVEYKGMYSDSAYTYIVGSVSDREKELVDTTQAALEKGIAKIKAGARLGDIGHTIDLIAKEKEFGNVLDLGGHGVGYAVHEKPFILHAGKPGTGQRLFENQVIAIEPMFTLGSGEVTFDSTSKDGWTVRTSDRTKSAHFEHTVLVTKKGYEVLTSIPESMILN